MQIEFDPRKNERNVEKHGLAFELVEECDWSRVRYEEQRGAYGERRYKAVVPLHGVLHVVVLTYRRSSMRVISFRIANRKERITYEKEG